ncbi:hypothetical protein BN946_scf184797.g6 [Trametes cinnabarina]|uniref:Exportin-T n=1 Tax=Pycnoporus cinnabarinus TaxID=5643 RepID=A0A060SUV7_PYCCI|nr:hypothetical protein BN946_scf184797.g6 [Trametes cinnabarina]
MEQDLNQFVQAILIASDPAQSSLHQQALQYLTAVQQNSSAWRLALAVFVEPDPTGGRKHPPHARFYALRVLDEFLDNRFEPLDDNTFETIRQSVLNYIQSEYIYGPAEADASFLRNKFAHTLTLFFLCTYVDKWPTFFTDFFALIHPPESTSQAPFNTHVSLLLFHIVLEISGEVADQLIKAARPFSEQRHARDARVRDAVRDRDAARINEAVLTIVADGVERMSHLRKEGVNPSSERELDQTIEVVDYGVRTFASYVGWIDINLTVTRDTVPLLFTLLSDPSLPIRLATALALTRIVAKGLKEPGDKLQLIKVLSLGQVLDALEEKTRAEQKSRGSDTDEGEESYREALGKLLNVLGLELCKLTDDCSDEGIRSEAGLLLNQLLPVMLRFLADEYDDTCSTVFPLLQTILLSRQRKSSSEPLDPTKRSFLSSLLGVILEKLKWDEESDPEDMDEDDKAAFEELRKELRTFMDSTLMIDPELVTEAVRTLALNTLTAYQNGVAIKWNDAELAVYLVYIFGEINKSGGKGRAAFCQAPALQKDKRKETDYSEYPLTSHGEMLYALVQSGISAYPHKTVQMQFFETVARYGDFFKVRKECIMPTLQAMLDTRGLHSPESSTRSRVYYLFYRFIREDRNEISPEVAVSLLEGIRDLLVIQVELPELENPDPQDILQEAVSASTIFDSQLYLFEAVGTLVSLLQKSPDQAAALLLSVVRPLLDELSVSLQAAKGPDDVLAILKVHHIIMALGNIAKGFPEYPNPVPEGYTAPPLDVFREVGQAILVCLEAMNVFRVVRDATRFAFARILATTGSTVAQLIPTLMANLLAHFEPTELIDFMNFIGLSIHKLQEDLLDVLDQLIGPLSTHINGILAQPVTGTDDQVTHVDTKRAYLGLLNSIVSSKLHTIFISDRNKAQLENLLESMLQLAEDPSDPTSQKAAFSFFGRCVNVWAEVPKAPGDQQVLPGFERFVYERVIPTAFAVLSLPQFNIKDGQIVVVLHEIANFLQTVSKTRGQEAFDFFVNVFLPSQNWPQATAVEFATKMRDLDPKGFRKYFTDFHGPDVSIDETWAKLSRNIVEIQNHNAANLSFEENHRYAYNMVLYKHGEKLYKGTTQLIAENLEKLAKEYIIPAFPAAVTDDPVQKSQEGEMLLKALKKVWDDHTSSLSKLRDVLKYMDRVYTTSAKVPPIWDAGLILFIKHIIKPPIEDHVIAAILTLIQVERDGYTINRSSVKGCVDVFIQLTDPDSRDAISLYRRDVEPAVLRESETFYRQEGEKLLETCDAPEYLRRVEGRFHEEESRTHHILSTQTTPHLQRILEQHLVSAHLWTVVNMPNSGLDAMIDTDKFDDLARLYRLFTRVSEGLPCLKKSLRETVIRRGKEINDASTGLAVDGGESQDEEVGEASAKAKGKAKARAPNAASQTLVLALKWVQDVLDLKDKFDTIWSEAFARDRELESGLNDAFQTFINLNEKSPEFISLFIDDNLKKGLKGKSDTEVDMVLDKTITVFRYITDKDVFERYYKGHLAKRLLLGRSVSDDAERGMLAKLKVECGYQFTQKLEGMFHDMKISAETLQAYRDYLAKNSIEQDIELSVIVMTSTFWPMSHSAASCTFPAQLISASRSFERFYLSRHSGRRLKWQPSLGNADVRVQFKSRKHDLNVSTFALVILLLFEDILDDQFLTYEEIKNATAIPDVELKRQLQSLACAKYKILKKHPPGRDVNPTDSFSFNVDFSASLQKIKISTIASRVENTEERKETKDRIDEERKHQMDACIVRIMKDRKHMTHNDLVNEVTRQLASRFQPNPVAIKKRIENLIEREYLERCEDRKSYNYLA